MKHSVCYIWLLICIVPFCQNKTYYVKEGDSFTCEQKNDESWPEPVEWNLITANGTTMTIAKCDKFKKCFVIYDQTNFYASNTVIGVNNFFRTNILLISMRVNHITRDMRQLKCLYRFFLLDECSCSFEFGVPPTYSPEKTDFDSSIIIVIVIGLVGGLTLLLVIRVAFLFICQLRKENARKAHTRTMRNQDTNTIFTVEQSSNLHHTETQTESILSQSTTSFSTPPLTSNIPLRNTTSHRNSNLNERGQQNNLRMSDDYPPSYSSLFRSVLPIRHTTSRQSVNTRHTTSRQSINSRHTTSHRNSNLNERGQQNNLRMSDDYPPSYSSLFSSV
ncbi:uncharacterized protein LOC131934850 [Physella acuta]|uniref:uncharacterized protein LOC131934850 n=1 Tax=Physella acuta TaxID=109671 RepID=UPI0027DD1886|nr:uncharacterized protein LOC131934850 [Physella acuta]